MGSPGFSKIREDRCYYWNRQCSPELKFDLNLVQYNLLHITLLIVCNLSSWMYSYSGFMKKVWLTKHDRHQLRMSCSSNKCVEQFSQICRSCRWMFARCSTAHTEKRQTEQVLLKRTRLKEKHPQISWERRRRWVTKLKVHFCCQQITATH